MEEELQKITVVMKTKVGENGRLFGSITTKEIAEQLETMNNLNIDKRKLELDDPIKAVGEYFVKVKLHSKVTAKVKVVVTEK